VEGQGYAGNGRKPANLYLAIPKSPRRHTFASLRHLLLHAATLQPTPYTPRPSFVIPDEAAQPVRSGILPLPFAPPSVIPDEARSAEVGDLFVSGLRRPSGPTRRRHHPYFEKPTPRPRV